MLLGALDLLRRRGALVLVIGTLSAGAGVLFQPHGAANIPDRWTSVANLGLADPSSEAEARQVYVSARQGAVREAAVRRMAEPTALDQVSYYATFDEGSDILSVHVRAPKRDLARPAAIALAQAMYDVGNEDRRTTQRADIADAQAAVDDLERRLAAFAAANPDAYGPNGTQDRVAASQRTILERDLKDARETLRGVRSVAGGPDLFRIVSVTPTEAVPKDRLQLPATTIQRTLLAGATGLVLALGLGLALEQLNPRVDDPAQVEAIVGAPVLASVVALGRRARAASERFDQAQFVGPHAEAHRELRTHLDFLHASRGRVEPARILVVSAGPAEGKTSTAGALALAVAEEGYRVVAVDADVRRPRLGRRFGRVDGPGLTSLARHHPPSPAELIRHDPLTGVEVIASGPPTSHMARIADRTADLTRGLQRDGAVVVVDSSPVLVANDAVELLRVVDWVLVVARLGVTTERALRQAVASLRLNDAEVVGCVVIGARVAKEADRLYRSYYDETPERTPEPDDRPADLATMR